MNKKNTAAINHNASSLSSVEHIERIRRIKNKHEKYLFQRPEITAVAISLMKDENGAYTSDVGIAIYFDPEHQDSVADLPPTLEGICTQVRPWRCSPSLETESEQVLMDNSFEQEGLYDNTRRQVINPMIGGISVSPDFIYLIRKRGTIGLIVRDNITGNALVLSTKSAMAGKRPHIDDGVSQPARRGLGDRAAELVMWEKGDIHYYEERYFINAALARPTNGRAAEVGRIYGLMTPIVGVNNISLDMEVLKSGVGGVTYGRVTNTDFTIVNAEQSMSRMFVVESVDGDFSNRDDCGSAILTLDEGECQVVGLLNEKQGEFTLCSLISPILAYFNCSVA